MGGCSSFFPSLTFVQGCGVIGFLCAGWNLFGDLYYLDFYTAHLSMEDAFGMIRTDLQSGYLFQFDGEKSHPSWPLMIAQAGSWMYPIWAFVTVAPLYIGLEHQKQGTEAAAETSTTDLWNRVVPCGLLAYGLCVVGGGLHSAFVFLTVLPYQYHSLPSGSQNGYDDWSKLGGSSDDDGQSSSFLLSFLNTAQAKITQHIVVGSLPGLIACNIGALWVAFVVQTRGPTHYFPKWFNVFNPMVTTVWVQFLAAVCPNPTVGFYFAGCLGTWGFFVFNLGTTYFLWNQNKDKDGVGASESSPAPSFLSSLLLSNSGGVKSEQDHAPGRGAYSQAPNYNSVK